MRIGVIGCGNIGSAIVRALLAERAGPHRLEAVLVRSARKIDGVPSLTDANEFFARDFDCIVEAAGPEAFRTHAARALERCDVIAVSPLPLADAVLEASLRATAARTRHVLRIPCGAIGGLDAIRTAMAGGLERLDVFVDIGPTDGPERITVFDGTAREAAKRFPDEINVVIIAALAGPGFDATSVRVTRPPAGTRGRTMGFRLSARSGSFEVISRPPVINSAEVHMAAASVIAMLREVAPGAGGIVVG